MYLSVRASLLAKPGARTLARSRGVRGTSALPKDPDQNLIFRAMRNTTAARRHQRPRDTAQLPTTPEADVTAATELRARLSREFDFTYTDLMIHAVARALVRHPRMNARESEGSIELMREVSWSNVRDKLNIGLFDAAHLLSPMAIASSLGIGHVRIPLIAPFNLGLNGNAITVSPRLHAAMAKLAEGDLADPAVSAKALMRVVEARKAGGAEPLTFGMTFPFSNHNYQLRFWMAAGGIDPDEDVRLVALPPPYMVESLASGHVDGFCVGAPWNSVAVEAGLGHLGAHATGSRRRIDGGIERVRGEGLVVGAFGARTSRGGGPQLPTPAPVAKVVGGVARGSARLHRPGHFRGVATVCLKLFNLVRPERAYFGQKDAQQTAVVRRLVRDLDVPVEIRVVPTVRDPDGLAISSRNGYLSPAERTTALALPAALRAGAEAGDAGPDAVLKAAGAVLDEAAQADPPLVTDYLALVDPATFAQVGAGYAGQAVLLAAARAGATRLIDNMPLVLGGAS